MDPRLIVKLGKRGKTSVVKLPCPGECAGCDKQFKPVPFEGKKYCLAYIDPQAKWTSKTCPFMYKPEPEKEQKINPIKASRRRVKQASSVTVAAGSKESDKKKKGKKMERSDSR